MFLVCCKLSRNQSTGLCFHDLIRLLRLIYHLLSSNYSKLHKGDGFEPSSKNFIRKLISHYKKIADGFDLFAFVEISYMTSFYLCNDAAQLTFQKNVFTETLLVRAAYAKFICEE